MTIMTSEFEGFNNHWLFVCFFFGHEKNDDFSMIFLVDILKILIYC